MNGPVSSYSLAGVRTATVEPQQHLTLRAIEVLAADERVLAAWLVGGFAVGDGDAFSDVDLQCTIRDDAVDEFRTSWNDLVNRIAPTVRINPFPGAIGGSCLFLYMLGNMVSVVGRDEVIPGSNGVVMVRDIAFVGLLLAEQGLATAREHTFANPFPFTKRLRRYLTDEQNALLESLPPLEATWDSVIDGYVALARAFLPRARRLASATGTPWPADYERATIDYFERMLGVEV